MFRRLWAWLSSMFRARPEQVKAGSFDAIIAEAQSEVAALIKRYQKTRRAAR
jgi:hypothetical protein